MTPLLSDIRDFAKTVHAGLLIFCMAYASLLIFLNYKYGIEPRILYGISNRLYRFLGFYAVYLLAFGLPYLAFFLLKQRPGPDMGFLLFLVLTAPAIFALKVSFTGVSDLIRNQVSGIWGRYYGIISNLPSKLLVVLLLLFLIWRLGRFETPFFGMTLKQFDAMPYLIMLLAMLPLIAWASLQHDFLHAYPKLKQVSFIAGYAKYPWLCRLLFEISYGIDFVTIELFFRGFLVLAFTRFAGQEAVLPMAVFYCSIHFGKPLAECISSFFGGLLLGIVVYKTRSITGGLMVHLGIAWMMEAGGYFGNLLKK